MRWVGLKNATGNFLVTYTRSDPGLISPKLSGGIHHISGLEYWSLTADAANSTAGVELSFDNVNSGGVTDLSHLRVARLLGDTWQNSGNVATSGSAGAAGSVTGTVINDWPISQPVIFTLASTQATQNPLPIVWKYVDVRKQDGFTILRWSTFLEGVTYYEVEATTSGPGFMTLARIPANPLLQDYSYTDRRMEKTANFYRVVIVRSDSSRMYSKIIGMPGSNIPGKELVRGIADRNSLQLYFAEPVAAGTFIRVFDPAGRQLHHADLRNHTGSRFVRLNCPLIRTQLILVQVIYPGRQTSTIRLPVP